MPRTPPDVSPERPRFITTPVHRCSRRQLGLPPEYGALFESEPTREDPGPGVMAQPVPTSVVLQQPREPTSFRGEAHEDVEDWLEQFERVATFNQWSATEKLRQVYYSLADGARTWYENREGRLDTWGDFCREIKESFANADRRDHAQRVLDARFQKPNETVSMFAEDMARLFRRADPDMAESKKVRYLMHGVKEQLFAGLVRNPPSTVDEFVREATAIERALRQRSRQYDRHAATPQPSISALLARDDDNLLRDLIRVVLREELVKCGIIPSAEPAQACVANIVRQEIRNALSVPVAEVEPPRQMSYAAALTCQAPARPTRPAAPTLPYPPPRPDDCWHAGRSRNLLLAHSSRSVLGLLSALKRSSVHHKFGRLTSGALQIIGLSATTAVNQATFIGGAPTVKSGCLGSLLPPFAPKLEKDPPLFPNTSPSVAPPHRFADRDRSPPLPTLHPAATLLETDLLGGLPLRPGETRGRNLGRQGC